LLSGPLPGGAGLTCPARTQRIDARITLGGRDDAGLGPRGAARPAPRGWFGRGRGRRPDRRVPG